MLHQIVDYASTHDLAAEPGFLRRMLAGQFCVPRAAITSGLWN